MTVATAAVRATPTVSVATRASGAALVIASLLLIAGNVLHPRQTLTGEILPADGVALMITGNLGIWQVAHLLVVLIAPFLVIGAYGLYCELQERGEFVYSLPALVAVGFYAILVTIAVMLDGYVEQDLARRFVSAPVQAKVAIASQIDLTNLVLHWLLAPAFFGLWLGGGLFGASLARARLFPRPFAWAGMALAAIGVVGYVAGIFGPYWVESGAFAPYAMAFTVWYLAIGVLMLRGHHAPAGTPHR